MISKCTFLNQLRYCYASADINIDGEDVYIRFSQELNMKCGAEVMRFLLMPLCELSTVNCRYTVHIFTPSMVYRPCIVSLTQAQISIENVNPFEEIVIAS